MTIRIKLSTLFIIMFISAYAVGQQHNSTDNKYTHADSLANAYKWALLPFIKLDKANPILTPGTGSFTDPILKKKVLWEEKDVFNPAIVNRNGKIYMLYRAQDKTGKPEGTSRIGLAVIGNDADAVPILPATRNLFFTRGMINIKN